jgi:hypothetical protein
VSPPCLTWSSCRSEATPWRDVSPWRTILAREIMDGSEDTGGVSMRRVLVPLSVLWLVACVLSGCGSDGGGVIGP